MSDRQEGDCLARVENSHKCRYYFASNYLHDRDYVLDACCGVGYGSYILATNSQVARIDAFDVSGNAIEKAKINYSHPVISFCKADFYGVQLIPSFYNLITCFEGIEHLEDPVDALIRLNEALDPDGKLLLSTPNGNKVPHDLVKYPEHFRHYTVEDMYCMLNETGFTNILGYSQPHKHSLEINRNLDGDVIIYECTK